ncbi:Hypothetical predicted protein [Mytilus galloprovincialis]|uniref:Up-regulator of cell proliferation-like domain-containing protein n=1 Tax=Mytilus galloprovincialis TaxID=29158 RepID=A0A8B6DJM6_MYTGA|nr:Hypothetical predicted protein [Mytilus galloprovincialis]
MSDTDEADTCENDTWTPPASSIGHTENISECSSTSFTGPTGNTRECPSTSSTGPTGCTNESPLTTNECVSTSSIRTPRSITESSPAPIEPSKSTNGCSVSPSIGHTRSTNTSHPATLIRRLDEGDQCKESKIKGEEKNEDNLQQILVQLDLIKYYPGKLNIEDVFKVNLSNGLKNFSDIKWYILSLIIGVDSRARDEALAKALRSLESGDITTGRSMFRRGKTANVGGVKVCVHPQDVLCALFLCSSYLLQKILVSKLFMCKIAIPFVFKLESRLICSFWPLHFIRVEGKYKNNRGIDGFLSDKELKSISFLKIGETEVSKSELVNRVIKSRVLMESFYHRNCILGNNSRSISNGSIEFSLFLPSGKDSDAFDDIILSKILEEMP